MRKEESGFTSMVDTAVYTKCAAPLALVLVDSERVVISRHEDNNLDLLLWSSG